MHLAIACEKEAPLISIREAAHHLEAFVITSGTSLKNNPEKNMSVEAQPRFATFEDFYKALDAERHLSQRLSDHPDVSEQLRESLRKLYNRIQDDPDFEKQLAASPQETALAFFHEEIAHYTLSDEDLESVAGGTITTDSNLGYDIGYAIGAAAEWIVDRFK